MVSKNSELKDGYGLRDPAQPSNCNMWHDTWEAPVKLRDYLEARVRDERRKIAALTEKKYDDYQFGY